MGNLYKIIGFILLSGTLATMRATELGSIDFEGPYQTAIKKTPGQKHETPDALRKTLSNAITSFPSTVVNIVASYFVYKKNQNLTLHVGKCSAKIIKHDSYSIPIIHVDPSKISGSELLASVAHITRLPQTLFKLQEWTYQKSPQDEEERYAEGHDVASSNAYPLTTFDRYTFGIDIPHDNEWESREKIVSKDVFTLGLESAFSPKNRSCIIA